jgi:hypothetical protein
MLEAGSFCIKALPGHELGVCPKVDDAALIENQHHVTMPQGSHPVRN